LRAELTRGAGRRRFRDRGRRAGRRLRRSPGVRHRRAARADGGRAQPHEPRRGLPRRPGPGRLSAQHALPRGTAGRDRFRRPERFAVLRRALRGDHDRGRLPGAAARAARPHAPGRLRGAPAERRCRRRRHRLPQPARGQRLQGLRGRAVEAGGRGVQIVPPADAGIAECIAAVGPIRELPVADAGWTFLGPDLSEQYLEAICALPDAAGPRKVRIVHTALHGVGTATALEALHRTGFTDVHVVAEQAEPDPDFPTVAFPTPEEPGAIDLALDLARTRAAALVIADDRDADRRAGAVVDPPLGQWRMLRGDELGVRLGAHRIRRHGYSGVMARSVVSSRWLGHVADAAGLESATTLTGFKWIARAAGIAYGYEEAIGYCVLPEVVRDKDGLSAALMVAEMAAEAKAAGTTLVGRLDELARRDGLHATSQLSIRVEDLSLIDEMMQRLRLSPPTELIGSPVTSMQDLSQGSVATTGLPPTDGVALLSADDTRVVVRPSGTEPKLKCYLEVVEHIPAGGPRGAMAELRERAGERLEQLTQDLREALGRA